MTRLARHSTALAKREYPELLNTCGPDTFGRFGFSIVRESERAEVRGHARLRAKVLMRFDRLLGRHVHSRHEPLGPERTDRQQRQPRRTKSRADLGEVFAVARVCSEEDRARGCADHERRP